MLNFSMMEVIVFFSFIQTFAIQICINTCQCQVTIQISWVSVTGAGWECVCETCMVEFSEAFGRGSGDQQAYIRLSE